MSREARFVSGLGSIHRSWNGVGRGEPVGNVWWIGWVCGDGCSWIEFVSRLRRDAPGRTARLGRDVRTRLAERSHVGLGVPVGESVITQTIEARHDGESAWKN